MKRTLLPGFIVLFLVPGVAGQDSTRWHTEAAGNLSFTQVGFYRWHEGGINSLALGGGLSLAAQRTSRLVEQSHDLRLTFGIVKQNQLELRKADDLIHLRSSISLQKGSLLGPFQPVLTIDIRSQFAPGYKYDSKEEEPPLKISDLLSPAILLQTLGASFETTPWLTVQAGLASKQTVVLRETLRERYKVQDASVARAELGLSGLILIDSEPFRNVRLKHSLSLFAAYGAANTPDFVSETLITMRINDWLQVNAEYTAQLDRDVSRAVQMKEVVSLGLAFSLLPGRHSDR